MKILTIALSLFLLTGCWKKVNETAPAPTSIEHWTMKYSLECDNIARISETKKCIAQFYRLNPKQNPELESEAYNRCRLASSVMFCTWRKP